MVFLRSLFMLLLVSLPATAEVAWVKNYDDALKQAAAEKKFVVLDLSASWCGYCRRMAREVYPDPQVVEFSRDHVFVRLMVDTDPAAEKLARKFNLRGFPTIIVVNSEGREVGRLVGARDAESLVEGLRQITAKPAALEE